MPYLPYEEPGITVILSLTSFLIILNGIRYVLDKLLYCGLIGEIFIGIIWGLPVGGTAWLTQGTQEVVQALGYLGLVGLVFEGGLSTSLSQLREAMILSVSVATVGLLMPIALSFLLILLPFESTAGPAYLTPLAAFSAGASLCSTSLGTTFAILSSANMEKTRIGVVLVGASMLDDVVGLVMVNIVKTLGRGAPGAWLIARPIVASFGLLIVTLCITPIVLRPAWTTVLTHFPLSVRGTTSPANDTNTEPLSKRWSLVRGLILARRIPHFGFILSTTVLLAFITIASFIDGSVLFAAFLAGGIVNHLWTFQDEEMSTNNASVMYDQYYRPLMDHLFVPFFFASIGFSIPIGSMFRGSVVWKGLLYTVMMTAAKASTGVVLYCEYYARTWLSKRKARQMRHPESVEGSHSAPHFQAIIVASAMVARGEIGFLIASLSQSSGTLTLEQNGMRVESSTGDEVFLVIIWAVMLCTIVGPAVVGTMVRRQARANHTG